MATRDCPIVAQHHGLSTLEDSHSWENTPSCFVLLASPCLTTFLIIQTTFYDSIKFGVIARCVGKGICGSFMQSSMPLYTPQLYTWAVHTVGRGFLYLNVIEKIQVLAFTLERRYAWYATNPIEINVWKRMMHIHAILTMLPKYL